MNYDDVEIPNVPDSDADHSDRLKAWARNDAKDGIPRGCLEGLKGMNLVMLFLVFLLL